ncbi:MAG: cation diffusion facilitator family transporter [Hyphomicrobiales bacterium]|nr:cation diffusion facilitator family transporter [Hyphomicrobiales bacterium]
MQPKQAIKQRVALTSIVASGALTVAKAAVGFASGSLAVLSEAAHSLLDFVATVMTYFAVRVSGRPADEEHHYGHGKIESVTALAETALLFLLSGIVIWEAVDRLLGGRHHAVEVTVWVFGVIAISIMVDYFRARLLYRVAAETSSEALEADALHFGSDMWSSIAVLIGLGAVALGYPWADSAAAVIVALFICIAGWRLGRRTIDTLTDTAPAGVAEKVRRLAEKVSGVVAIDRVRVRPAGDVLFVDLDLAVSRTVPLGRVAAIKERVAAAIHGEFRKAETTVNIMPRALDDETVMERVMVIARNRALAVHHVTVHAIGGALSVSLDLEVDGSLSFAKAHAIADSLEAALREELGPEVEVETHIEPLQTDDLSGRDAPAERVALIASALNELARASGSLRNVHEVRLRDTRDGAIVNFHCDVEPSLTVAKVHDMVDGLERALRERHPGIKRVIGHAEPRPSAPGTTG